MFLSEKSEQASLILCLKPWPFIVAKEIDLLEAEDFLFICKSNSDFTDTMSFCDKFIVAWQ